MTGFNFGAMLSQNNQIKQIPLDMLVPFHNHQFSLYDGERRDDMVESIRKNGVMTPIVCRPNPNGSDTYEILIGHNRWNCSKIAGLETIPAIIKEQLTEDEAQTYVDESNLIQGALMTSKYRNRHELSQGDILRCFHKANEMT